MRGWGTFIGLGHLVQLLGNRQQANCVTDPPSTESGKEQFGVAGRRVVGDLGRGQTGSGGVEAPIRHRDKSCRPLLDDPDH